MIFRKLSWLQVSLMVDVLTDVWKDKAIVTCNFSYMLKPGFFRDLAAENPRKSGYRILVLFGRGRSLRLHHHGLGAGHTTSVQDLRKSNMWPMQSQ